MSLEPGTRLYRYMIRKGRLVCFPGVVSDVNRRRVVLFDNSTKAVACPRKRDIGLVRHVGPSLWLDERDDMLATQIYLDYEMVRLNSLKKQIEAKSKVVEMLNENLEEYYEGLHDCN